MKKRRLLCAPPFAGLLVFSFSGCAVSSASPPEEQVPLLTLAGNIEEFRGRVVRTCAPRLTKLKEPLEWQMSAPFGRHGVGVRVLSCRKLEPVENGQACVTGRIARRNGSLEPLREGEPRVVTSSMISHTWYLHQRCV